MIQNSLNKPQNRLLLEEASQKLKNLIIKKQSLSQNHPVRIDDHLWLGNYAYASDYDFLVENKIGLVLSVMEIAPVKKY